MELCGESLKSWLQTEKDKNDLFVQLKQVEIVQNLISGLSYLHQNKILHRDLKPGNIMFSSENFRLPIKIGDFGLSRIIHSPESKTNDLTSGVGTEIYMAPEVRTSKDYSYQADLYSLGLIIWEVVQLIESKDRKMLIDDLTLDRNENLVQQHPLMTRVKELIVNLTKRRVEERIQNMDDVMEVCKIWNRDMVQYKIWYNYKEIAPKIVKN
jgi:serine/threonine protein kinase